MTFPAGGTGVIGGNVTFGNGTDSIVQQSGRIVGAVNQGDGADRYIISGGTVNGKVQQGFGIDDFRMTGGIIQSLSQGDNLDTFSMSAGQIVDFFEDGDRAVMTGGRIGRVDMKLDNNLFDMSGGTIERNLVTGFGNDTIILSNRLDRRQYQRQRGTDKVTISGGTLVGNALMSFGADTFVWHDGGTVDGTVDLGPDNDIATLTNLTPANLAALTP